MIVLIPAYEPDARLVDLVRALTRTDPALHVLVVDDGSGPAFADVFDHATALGAVLVRHDVNRGKGRALKTGFRHAGGLWPGEDVVCADSDGQHTPQDVLAVAERVAASRSAMVLGARHFTGPVPSRSRLGNGVTRRLFFLTTGIDLTDTQTGLRAYPAEMLDWLCEVEGERFEYELELLLRARDAGHAIVEVPVSTVYLDDNASSHFRPVRDSARVYAPMLRFAASSAVAAVVDYALLFLLHALTGNLALSVVGARVSSAGVNYATNRRFVFRRGGPASAMRYGALVAAVLAANWALLHVFVVGLGVGLLPAKLVTEAVLLFGSYAVQHRFVFSRSGSLAVTAPGGSEAVSAVLDLRTHGERPGRSEDEEHDEPDQVDPDESCRDYHDHREDEGRPAAPVGRPV